MRQKLTEARLAEVSLGLFQEKGFDNVSVMEICQACGITKPTFYKMVESKDALLLLYFRDLLAGVPERAARLETEGKYMEELWLMLTLSMERASEIGQDLFSHYLAYCFSHQQEINKSAFALRERIMEVIRKAEASGQIQNHSDPALLFRTLVNSGMGISCQWCFGTMQRLDNLIQFRRQMNVILCPAPGYALE